MYVVFARKYRPQTFEEVVGQEPIAKTLQNAIEMERVAHAYLFTGSRGVGKTSMARILAKALNCEKGPTTTPCCECPICKSIATGNDVDVVEMDAASNRGIDEIRQLRQNVKYTPSRARRKVYIIDEAHQLTGPAFNALLKTLEEPPAHVVFVLCTTDPQRLPETVIARCQRFDFRRISVSDIVKRLQQICKKEKVKAEPGALELVARHARGGMRDAQGALDQLCAFGSKKISIADVRSVLGIVSDETIYGLVDAFIASDARKALAILSEALDRGQEIGDFVDQLSGYLRDVLVVQSCGLDSGLVEPALLEAETVKKHAEALSRDSLFYMIQLLLGAKQRGRNDPAGRLVLELAILKMLQLQDLQSIEKLIGLIESEGCCPPGDSTTAPTARTGAAVRERSPRGSRLESAPANGTRVAETAEQDAPIAQKPLTAESLPAVWRSLVEAVRHSSPMLAIALQGARPRLDKGALVVEAPPLGAGKRLHDPEQLKQVSEAVRRITGQSVEVRAANPEKGSKAQTPRPATDKKQRMRKLGKTARNRTIAKEAAEDATLMRAFDLLDKEFGLEPTELDSKSEKKK